MEHFAFTFSSISFFVVVVFASLCFLVSLIAVKIFPFTVRLNKSNTVRENSSCRGCNCTRSCGKLKYKLNSELTCVEEVYLNGRIGVEEFRESAPMAVAIAERQTGASMMEQLVPEITTHALSYLDYPSLCRLSMTNSLMRKAANDDSAWKALYHKDFTLEQDNVIPVNGWKAYYAATRAIVNINTEFFNIIRERSLAAMRCLWLTADYVKCIHASGEFFSGYNAVIQSWQLAFNWEQVLDIEVRDVRVRVLADMAWIMMKTYIDMEPRPFNVTNILEFHNGRWYMVHHHSSVMLVDGEMEQQIVQG